MHVMAMVPQLASGRKLGCQRGCKRWWTVSIWVREAFKSAETYPYRL